MTPAELDVMPASHLDQMLQSMIRRKRWEARVQAVDLLNMVALAMGGDKGKATRTVPAAQMLRDYGIEFD